MYKNIKGEEIRQLECFINRYSLLFGIHVKYLVYVLALSELCTIVYKNSIPNEQQLVVDGINIIQIVLLVICGIKWLYAHLITQTVDASFLLFTKLEVYVWHKVQLEKYHEKRNELEMEKAKSEFYSDELDRLIKDSKGEDKSEKHLMEKASDLRLKMRTIEMELNMLSERIDKKEKDTEEQKKHEIGYETGIKNITNRIKTRLITDSDKVKIEILFQGLANQLFYQSK